jgi:hypothetical protein
MSGLKVRRLDSPLARTQPASEPKTAPAEAPDGASMSEGTASAPGERSLRVAPVTSAQSTEIAEVASGLPEPPPLEEGLELLSTRLPISLRRTLSELTTALRARNGLVSQKGLPEQEVLAMLIWAAGSPEDLETIERLDGLLSEFRARRYTAAAEALRS